MKEFRTIVSISPSNHKFGLKNGIFTIGSCFADAIGSRLKQSKFNVAVNPFGSVYNPLSIHKTILYALRNEKPAEQRFLTREDLHLNYDFHSDFSALSKTSLEHAIDEAIASSHHFLKTADCILVTYGTAWVYSEKKSGTFVTNCHKIPSDNFTKRLLSEQEIVESFGSLYSELKRTHPSIRFILTLSPVRHVKDTLPLNSVSKAVLRTACHSIANTFSGVEYFPAYEIMMDDLRDYRFYKSEMLHPTEEAEDYIWGKFKDTYVDNKTHALIDEWSALQTSLQHKPFHPQSKSHQNFLRDLLKKLTQLNSKMDVHEEIAAVRSQIIEP